MRRTTIQQRTCLLHHVSEVRGFFVWMTSLTCYESIDAWYCHCLFFLAQSNEIISLRWINSSRETIFQNLLSTLWHTNSSKHYKAAIWELLIWYEKDVVLGNHKSANASFPASQRPRLQRLINYATYYFATTMYFGRVRILSKCLRCMRADDKIHKWCCFTLFVVWVIYHLEHAFARIYYPLADRNWLLIYWTYYAATAASRSKSKHCRSYMPCVATWPASLSSNLIWYE